MTASRTACLVVAAGTGVRLGAGRPKAFVQVGGRSLLDRAVEGVTASGVVDALVLVVPAPLVGAVSTAHPGAAVVAGGADRQGSVAAGLHALAGDVALGSGVDVVLVHDAARAFTPPGTFATVVDAVRCGHAAVVPSVPLHDTVRSLGGGGAEDGGSALVDRATLRAVQTPQGFERAVLERAHRLVPARSAAATDDATLVERLGHAVHLVDGSPCSFKITGPLDLLLAAALATGGGAP